MQYGQEHFISIYEGLIFTVDTGAAAVDLVLAGNPVFSVDDANQYFEYGENLLIESIGLYIPYQFGIGDLEAGPIIASIGWQDASLNAGTVTELGINGNAIIPECNVEFPLNVFIPQPAAADSKWQLILLSLQHGRVNMFNCPATLHEEELKALVKIKVRHNFIMIA